MPPSKIFVRRLSVCHHSQPCRATKQVSTQATWSPGACSGCHAPPRNRARHSPPTTTSTIHSRDHASSISAPALARPPASSQPSAPVTGRQQQHSPVRFRQDKKRAAGATAAWLTWYAGTPTASSICRRAAWHHPRCASCMAANAPGSAAAHSLRPHSGRAHHGTLSAHLCPY